MTTKDSRLIRILLEGPRRKFVVGGAAIVDPMVNVPVCRRRTIPILPHRSAIQKRPHDRRRTLLNRNTNTAG